MNPKTLFLAWKDTANSRQWFPIGRLDADLAGPEYRFRYTGGAVRAQSEASFPLLIEFPHLEWDYRASRLFPLFQNRVMNQRRPDRARYLRNLVHDLTRAMTERPRDYEAKVVRINPQPAPSKQRVLIEMRGRWDGYEPMDGSDYKPVVGD